MSAVVFKHVCVCVCVCVCICVCVCVHACAHLCMFVSAQILFFRAMHVYQIFAEEIIINQSGQIPDQLSRGGGGYEGQFSSDPLPVIFVEGHCEQLQ